MKQLLIGLVCLLLVGCTQNNGYIGDIFGQWQLKEITDKNETIVGDGTLFMSFQNEVVLFRKMAPDGHGSGDYIGIFIHKNDSLHLELSHGNPTILESYQIENTTNPSFKIDRLDKKHLILSNGDKTWIYRKF